MPNPRALRATTNRPAELAGPVIRNSNLQFFLARADQARVEAEAATLDHVRERCRRSEAAWTVLADKAERSERLREQDAKRKAAATEAAARARAPNARLPDFMLRMRPSKRSRQSMLRAPHPGPGPPPLVHQKDPRTNTPGPLTPTPVTAGPLSVFAAFAVPTRRAA